METILEKLKTDSRNINNDEYKKLLQEAGMKVMSLSLPIITLDAIYEYLCYLVNKNYKTYEVTYSKYAGLFKGIREITETRNVDIYDQRLRYFNSIKINGMQNFSVRFQARTFREMRWNEVLVENFIGTPPIHVLKSIVKYKHEFENVFIVTIDDVEVKDPLVVGVRKNDNNRYLIDWWEDDIDVSKLDIK